MNAEQFDHNGTHVTVYRDGNLDYKCIFVKGNEAEHVKLHPQVNDIETAIAHAKALLD